MRIHKALIKEIDRRIKWCKETNNFMDEIAGLEESRNIIKDFLLQKCWVAMTGKIDKKWFIKRMKMYVEEIIRLLAEII